MAKDIRAQARLESAEGHIRDELGHIGRQKALIERMRAEGHSTKMAEKVLRTMEHSLYAFEMHRDLILKELGL
jgi:hypothetical protein